MAIYEEAQSMSTSGQWHRDRRYPDSRMGEEQESIYSIISWIVNQKLNVFPKWNNKWVVYAHLGKEKDDHKELALLHKCKFCQYIHFLF